MSISISNEHKLNMDNFHTKPYEEVYILVSLQGGEKKAIPLSMIVDQYDRVVFNNIETARPKETLNKVAQYPEQYKFDGKKILSVEKPIKLMLTSEVIQNSMSVTTNFAMGLKQQVGVSLADVQKYTDTSKVFVLLSGDRNFSLVDANAVIIKFNDGSTIPLSRLNDEDILRAMAEGKEIDCQMIYNNRVVKTLDSGIYEEHAVVDQESYDFEYDMLGKPTLMHRELGKPRTEAEPVRDVYTYCEYVQDEQEVRQILNRKFYVDNAHQGDRINVTTQQGERLFVALTDLFEKSGDEYNPIDVKAFKAIEGETNLSNFVGKQLYIKQDEEMVKLAPLTVEQVYTTYSNQTINPTVIEDSAKIATEGVYRQTTTGEFFEESRIQPLCYDYAMETSSVFDKYLFEIMIDGNSHTIVVDKDKFKSSSKIKYLIKGKAIELNLFGSHPPRKITRTNKPANQCAVIQTTTSGTDYNKATVLRLYNGQELSAEGEAQATEVYKQFLTDYRAGSYQVNDGFNSLGEKIEFRQTPDRFVIQDNCQTPDNASKEPNYDHFRSQTLTLSNGEFKGKPTYNSKKANKDYTSTALNIAKSSFSLMVTPLGFLSMLAFPVLPVVGLGAIASVPIANLVNNIHEAISKSKLSSKLKNPLQTNRDMSQQEILKKIAVQVKDITQQWESVNKKAKKTSPRKALTDAQVRLMMTNFLDVENQIDIVYGRQVLSGGLQVVNGTAKVTAQNAYLAKEFERLLAEKNKAIADIKKKIRRASALEKPALIDQLTSLEAERTEMLTNYTLPHQELPEDVKQKTDTMMLLNFAKGLMLAKFKNYELLTDPQKKLIDDLKPDFAKGTIRYKRFKYASISELIEKQPTMASFVRQLVADGESYAVAYQNADHEVFENKHEEETVEHTTSLIEKLTNKLASVKDIDKKIELGVNVNFDEVCLLLQKDKLTKEEQQLVDKYFKTLNSLEQSLNTQTAVIASFATGPEGEGLSAEDISTLLNTFKQISANIRSCAEKIQRLNSLFNRGMNEEQANKVKENIEALQKIIGQNQEQLDHIIEQISTYVKSGLVPAESVAETMSDELRRATEPMTTEEVHIKEDDEWRKRYVRERVDIITKAEKSIGDIDKLLEDSTVNEKEYEQIKQKVLTKSVYGAKIAIDKSAKLVSKTLEKVTSEISSVDERIATLKNLQKSLEDDTDDDLINVVVYAEYKIEALKKKKIQLQDKAKQLESLELKFKNLKAYVDVVKIRDDAEKLFGNQKFKQALGTDKEDVKFLAEAISVVKNLLRLSRQLDKTEIKVNRQATQNIEETKQVLPQYIEQLKEYIRQNYNIFNQCTDIQVCEKYYKKISDYSDIDHSVVFSMPTKTEVAVEETVQA